MYFIVGFEFGVVFVIGFVDVITGVVLSFVVWVDDDVDLCCGVVVFVVVVVECIVVYVANPAIVASKRVDVIWCCVVVGTREDDVALDLDFEWKENGGGMLLVTAEEQNVFSTFELNILQYMCMLLLCYCYIIHILKVSLYSQFINCLKKYI